MTNSAVYLENVSFAYPHQKEILQNITIDILSGQMVGIIGENGAGKSTLIKMFLGLVRPSRGQVYINGQKLSSFSDWPKIGYLSQKANSFNTSFPANVEEIIAAPLLANSLLPYLSSQVQEDIRVVLDLVGLQDYKKALIGNLSGGQQQRVFLARTLVTNPEILILDEPFVGIDECSQQSIIKSLIALNQQGVTIIFVSHDMRWLLGETDLILLLKDGKIKKTPN